MHDGRLKKSIMVFLFVISLFFAGCSQLTKENYDKLEIGMNYSEVVAILGDADECSSVVGTKSCTWGSENKHVKIKFVADKVVFFSGKGL